MDINKCKICKSYIPPGNEKTRWGMRCLEPEPGYDYPHRCDQLLCEEPELTKYSNGIRYPKTWEEIVAQFNGPKKG